MTIAIEPVLLSAKVALIATVVTTFFGIGTAWFMARNKFAGQNLVETFIGLPLVLPPTVIGFGLLLLFGKHGPVGILLQQVFGTQVIFTWWAAVIAAAVVSFPLMYRSAKAGFNSVDKNLEQAARTLGASELRIFFTVTLPLALPGTLAGILMAFTRSLGEFGATLMLAGNIPGQTQTIPLAIYFAAESGNMRGAGILVGIITILSFMITFFLNSWQSRKELGSTARIGVAVVGRSGPGVGDNCEKGFA